MINLKSIKGYENVESSGYGVRSQNVNEKVAAKRETMQKTKNV